MKINIILPALGRSGGIDVVYKYAELLSNKGHDVLIYKSVIANNMHRYANPLKCKIHQVYCTGKGVIGLFKQHDKYDKFVLSINNNSIRDSDIVIATAWPSAYEVNKLDTVKGRKYYLIQDIEIWDNERIGLESYLLPLNKIVISKWINKKLYDMLNIGPFPVVNNGLDLTLFYNDQKKYNVIQNNVRFLMLNHTLSKKGVELGLRAFEIAKEKYPNIELMMFGLCAGDNLPEYVEYIRNPTKEQLKEIYSSADVFIFPSLEEGWGLTPLEAMACKCAVIGTNTGFVLDLGVNGQNMLISEPGNIHDLSSNLMVMINDSELRQSISEKGYQLAKTLDWNESANKLLSCFEQKNE